MKLSGVPMGSPLPKSAGTEHGEGAAPSAPEKALPLVPDGAGRDLSAPGVRRDIKEGSGPISVFRKRPPRAGGGTMVHCPLLTPCLDLPGAGGAAPLQLFPYC